MNPPKLLQIYTLMSLQAILLGCELVAAQLTHSLILLADAYHTLYTIMTFSLFIISFKMTNEKTLKNTFGWARVEVLGMLVNVTFVTALSFSLLVEGIQQIIHASHEISHPTDYKLLFSLGVCGFIINSICLYYNKSIINYKSEETKPKEIQDNKIEVQVSKVQQTEAQEKLLNDEINCEAIEEVIQLSHKKVVFMETLQWRSSTQVVLEAFSSSFLVIVCGLVVVVSGNSPVAILCDPILGILVTFFLCYTIYPTMKNTGLILLQTVPQNIDVGSLKRKLLKEFPLILNVHELHIWCLTKSQVIATCHLILSPETSNFYSQFSQSLKQFFHKEGISLATVQPEFKFSDRRLCSSHSCLIQCSNITQENCDSLTCCKHEDVKIEEKI